VGKALGSDGKLVREMKPIMDFGFFTIVQDPDGNYIGLMDYLK